MQVTDHNFVETSYMPGEYPGFFVNNTSAQVQNFPTSGEGCNNMGTPSQRAQNFPG